MTQPNSQLTLDLGLRDEARFESYVGEVAGQLRSFLDGPANGVAYLRGGPESGKSHLLQAACRRSQSEGKRSMYCTGFDEHSPAVLDGLDDLQLLCLDDIEPLARDLDWCTSLFHLLNGIVDRGGRLIVAATVPVGDLPVALADLESRLRAAIMLTTPTLDDAQKIEVLKLRAGLRGLHLADDVGRYIMSRSYRGMVHLMHVLDTLDESSLSEQKRLTIPFVKHSLGL